MTWTLFYLHILQYYDEPCLNLYKSKTDLTWFELHATHCNKLYTNLLSLHYNQGYRYTVFDQTTIHRMYILD